MNNLPMAFDPAVLSAMRAWRHDLHAHPETAFEEHRTGGVVAEALARMGLEVHRGLGGTGVVGTLRRGNGPVIALRADMDALDITEQNAVPHASTHAGKMHACGHDGHTAMLLGAVMHLVQDTAWRGTLRCIFQPAEENEGGGRKMVEQGLFTQFPCDAVYGLHNWPGLPLGTFAVNPGPMMAGMDLFEITVTGKGTHGAMPERGIDPFMPVAQIVMALQTIPSRTVSALDAAIVTVTQIHGGDAMNVIPDSVVLRGTSRYFKPELQAHIEQHMQRIIAQTAAAHGCTARMDYRRCYPPTINSAIEAAHAVRAATALVGAASVRTGVPPSMAGEDFAFMLLQKPGAYMWMGVDGANPSAALHNPHYDFNDDALALGAGYWVTLVRQLMPA